MAVTIYTYRSPIGTDGTLWVTSGTYRLKNGSNFDMWCKVVDTSTVSPSAPTASTASGFFSVGTITTKSSSGDTWIGTIRLIAGTATTNTSQTLSIKYGSTTYTCNIRVNGTANGFSTNPTLASNFTYDDSNHAPITAWGASKSANLHWAMSTSNIVPPDSGWANALSSFTSVIRNAGTYYLWYKMQSTSTTYNDVPPTLYGTSITCSKATLTCTGSSHTVTYGAAVPTLSITYSGWKGDDGTSDLTTLPTVSTTYTSSSNVSGSPYPVTVSGGSAINYSFSYVNGSITVNKAASRLSLTPTSATVYTQGTYNVSAAVQAHDGTVTYAITASTTTGTSTVTSAGVVTCGTMSTSNDSNQSITVTVSDPGDGNHNSGSKTFTITVQKYTATIAFNNSTTSVTYGNTLSVAATATASGGTVGSFTYSLSSTTYLTISGSTVTAVQYSGSTTTTVTATLARTSTVKAGTKTRTLTCTKATLTCTGSSHSITYSDAVPTLSITYSGWKFSDSTSSLTTVPTVTTTYTRGSNKGSYPTTVSGGVATNYTFSYVAGSITVSAKTANLGWGTLTWTYDGSTHSTTCGVSNLYGTDTCTVTLSGNSVGKNVGTATVTATALSNSNYALPSTKTATLTINAKEVSLTWGTTSWVYDGSTHSTTCTAGNLVSGDTCTVTLTGNSVGKNVGSATVTASSLSNSNYKLPSSGLTTTITITQRVATLSWGTTSWTYDGQAHSTTCTVSNLVSGDTCTVTLYNNSITNYGSVDVVATGLSNNNYILPYSKINTGLTAGGRTTVSGGTVSTTGVNADTYFTINLSENISVGTKYIIECDATYPSSDIYWVFPLGQQNNSSLAWYLYQGHNTKVFTANDISWGTKRIFMDDNGGNGRTSVCSFSNFVVEHWDAASQNGRCKTISITKRAVTLTAANKSKTYGDANPTLTSSITSGSLVSSGDLGTLGATTTATQSSAVGTYTITPTYTANTNYTVTTANGTLTINKRTVTITWGTVSWVYDGSAHSANPTLGNIYASDVVRYTITGNSITHKGTTTATITALDNSNYQLPSSGTSATLTITQATTVLSITSITTPLRVAESGSVVATTNFGTIGYSSSDTSVATVSSSGVLYGVTSGTVTITVSVATNSYGDWTAATATTTLTIINGMKVYYDGAWKDAVPYVYFDGQWRKAIAYVHNGTTWKPC